MNKLRFACYPLLILLIAICSLRSTFASPVIITVAGTVQAGTDGNPNSTPPGAGKVFGTSSDLAGQPFTLFINLDTELGASSFDTCSNGSVAQSSNTGLHTTAHPSAVLQIGKGSYSFGAFNTLGNDWTTYRAARTSCTSYNVLGFGWSETYTGDYGGGAGFGSIDLYATNPAAFSGDWRSSVPTTPVTPGVFQFNISVFQVGSPKLILDAHGYLKASTIEVNSSSTCSSTGDSASTLGDLGNRSASSQIGLNTVEPHAFVDCAQKLADLSNALQNFEDRLADILAIEADGGTPDAGHLKALDQAENALLNASTLVKVHCAGTAAAATLIAGAEAALEAAAPYLPYLLCL
jgi:hypothetical protein